MMHPADAVDLLARVGAELGFLTPLEPCDWPGTTAVRVAVAARPPGRLRIVVALEPGVAEAMAAHLGAAASPDEVAAEVANVLAGHLLPALPGGADGFLPPRPWSGTPDPPMGAVAVRFAEGRIGMALVERDETLPDPD